MQKVRKNQKCKNDNKCVYGKVIKTNLVQRNSENIKKNRKYKKNGILKKKIKNLKYVKCQWEEMIHIKINC